MLNEVETRDLIVFSSIIMRNTVFLSAAMMLDAQYKLNTKSYTFEVVALVSKNYSNRNAAPDFLIYHP